LASPVHYPSLFRLAATGRVWVTGDHGADGAPVEVQRQVRKEISKCGPRRAACDTQASLSGQCGDFPVTLGNLRLP